MQTHRVLWPAVIACTLALAGCGSSGSDTTATPAAPAVDTDTELVDPSSNATRDDVIEEAVDTCAALGPKKMAADYGIDASDLEAIARHLARTYPDNAKDEIEARCVVELGNYSP